MLGAYAVGKTSLVARFVRGIFSDKYLTTVGVKIDKKTIEIANREMSLILWDLAGEDEFYQVRRSYLFC
jgi:GTPase SAR1 family protein